MSPKFTLCGPAGRIRPPFWRRTVLRAFVLLMGCLRKNFLSCHGEWATPGRNGLSITWNEPDLVHRSAGADAVSTPFAFLTVIVYPGASAWRRPATPFITKLCHARLPSTPSSSPLSLVFCLRPLFDLVSLLRGTRDYNTRTTNRNLTSF